MKTIEETKVHFSVDDVLNSLLWLEKNNKKSIFDAKTFQIAKYLYETYEICSVSEGKENLWKQLSELLKIFQNFYKACVRVERQNVINLSVNQRGINFV